MNILLWHVHGSWTTSFVRGPDTYLVPMVPDRGPDGRGRARTWDWPGSVVEVPHDELRRIDVDIVLLQRPRDIELLHAWTGLKAGSDVPAVYVEHNAPAPSPVQSRHPMADQHEIPIVHVTHFNRMFWDNGAATTHVIEHGIVDPGHRWTGEVPHAAVVVNEPVRRHRVTGTDLIGCFAQAAPVDVFGEQADGIVDAYGLDPSRVRVHGGLDQHELHAELARRRVYVHTPRWTSLGLALIEAMHLGMPIVAVGATEAHRAVPPEAGVVSTDLDELRDAVETFVTDPAAAQRAGSQARSWAIQRYGLEKFLKSWQSLLEELVV